MGRVKRTLGSRGCVSYRTDHAELSAHLDVSLDELKASTEDSWETMVGDMEKMHDVFTHSFFSFFQVPQTSGDEEKSPKAGHSDGSKKA